MHRDRFNYIILGLQKFELYKSIKIWHIYIYCNIKISESETLQYFYPSHIYTAVTLKLILHHLIMKSNVQHNNIMSL